MSGHYIPIYKKEGTIDDTESARQELPQRYHAGTALQDVPGRRDRDGVGGADPLAGRADLSALRFLDPVWIGLTEQVLISEYRPTWNVVVDGFGHHDQGRTRRNQRRSRWDTLHPGRSWAAHYQDNVDGEPDILKAIAVHRETVQ